MQTKSTYLSMMKLVLLCALGTFLRPTAGYAQTPAVKERPIENIVILLYDGFTPLDAVGPYQVLSGMMGAKVKTVATKKGLVKSDGVLTLKADYALSEITQADILIIPGGLSGTWQAAHNPQIIEWVKKIDKTTMFTASVCTGAWVLGEAGLLKNKNATTYWAYKRTLESYGARYTPARYVQSGKIFTAAGVSAGIDMALALLAATSGEDQAKMVQLGIEYDPQPPFQNGSEAKSDTATVHALQEMFDMALANVKAESSDLHAPASSSIKKTDVAKQESIADVIDPVCKMNVKANSPLLYNYQGKQYRFCSRMCRDAFSKDPARFVK